MKHLDARIVAELGQGVSESLVASWHDPQLLDAIEERWQRTGKGVTLEVMVHGTPSISAETAWHEVGRLLTQGLLSLGQSVGLYIDSAELHFDTVLGWVRTGTSNGARALADVTLVTRPHVAGFPYNMEYVKCVLFQQKRFAGWLPSIWADCQTGDFFYPDFVLAAYGAGVMKGIPQDIPLTEQVFTEMLDRAVGWLIPYGDPPLFILGVPTSSRLYRDLRPSRA